jgi:hypothetical protein
MTIKYESFICGEINESTRKVIAGLEEFDKEYEKIDEEDDQILGQMCDSFRRRYLLPIIEVADTIELCGFVRGKILDRNTDINTAIEKRENIIRGGGSDNSRLK